jgi:hypothetical protein
MVWPSSNNISGDGRSGVWKHSADTDVGAKAIAAAVNAAYQRASILILSQYRSVARVCTTRNSVFGR